MPRSERDVVIGKVVAPFGTRGEVKVVILTDFPERFDAGNEVILDLVSGERWRVPIEGSRLQKTGICLKLKGVNTRMDAAALRGVEIVIDESELGELSEDQFYVFQVIGLKVATQDGREQGVVTEVMQGAANDVYITSTGLCIPALKSVVAKIDIKNGLMVIVPVPGLLPEE